MALEGPIEIYGLSYSYSPPLATLTFMTVSGPTQLEVPHVRAWLLRIVRWCLDNDPELMPKAALSVGNSSDGAGEQDDDFRFWDGTQAQRIADIVRLAVGVEYSAQVIIADANVTSLARMIVASKRLLQEA